MSVKTVLGEHQQRFPIVEIFGPTVQGEGPLIGRQTHFIRFGGCDYRCVWCDSMHAVDPKIWRKNSVRMNSEEILTEIQNRRPAPWITLSGGNPAIQLRAGTLIDTLKKAGFLLTVETQGTLLPTWMHKIDKIVVSPKPPSSKMETNWKQLEGYVAQRQSIFKVVVFDDADYEYAKNLHTMWPQKPMYLSVGNYMTEDNTKSLIDKLRWLTEKVLADDHIMSNVIVLPQLHVLIWGNKQGV